jgi:DNA-binding NarL/FixJ family response regulator
MTALVAAVNTPRLLALGLSRELEGWGYSVESVDDPRGWAKIHPEAAMFVAVRNPQDEEFLIDLMSDLPAVPVVALLDPMSVDRIHLCMGAGARGCVSMDWSSGDLALVLDVGLRGMATMPATIARNLAARRSDGAYSHGLTSTQWGWLRDLASGTTVRALAAQVGFSERVMYRRLSQVYRKMGCATRTEALLRASACGMLDQPVAVTERSLAGTGAESLADRHDEDVPVNALASARAGQSSMNRSGPTRDSLM